MSHAMSHALECSTPEAWLARNTDPDRYVLGRRHPCEIDLAGEAWTVLGESYAIIATRGRSGAGPLPAHMPRLPEMVAEIANADHAVDLVELLAWLKPKGLGLVGRVLIDRELAYETLLPFAKRGVKIVKVGMGAPPPTSTPPIPEVFELDGTRLYLEGPIGGFRSLGPGEQPNAPEPRVPSPWGPLLIDGGDFRLAIAPCDRVAVAPSFPDPGGRPSRRSAR